MEIKIESFEKGWCVSLDGKGIHASDKPHAILSTVKELLAGKTSEPPEIPKKQPPPAPKIVKV